MPCIPATPPANPSAGHAAPADTGQLHAQLRFGKQKQGCAFRLSPSLIPAGPPNPSRQHGAPAKGWLSVSPAVFPLWGWEAETCCNTPDEAAPGAFPDGNLAAEPVLGPHPARACKAPRPGEEQACVGVLPAPAQGPPHTPLPGTGGALTLCQMLQGETEARVKPGSVLVSVLPWSSVEPDMPRQD